MLHKPNNAENIQIKDGTLSLSVVIQSFSAVIVKLITGKEKLF